MSASGAQLFSPASHGLNILLQKNREVERIDVEEWDAVLCLEGVFIQHLPQLLRRGEGLWMAAC